MNTSKIDNNSTITKGFTKTSTGFRDMHSNTPERNKTIVIRKIIMYAIFNLGFLQWENKSKRLCKN